MQPTLIDIELLPPPPVDNAEIWLTWLLVSGLIAFSLWGLRRAWHHPRVLIWRWQRCLQQNIPVQQVALRVYGWVQTHHIILPQELQIYLHQACFSEHSININEFRHWLTQLREWL